MGDIIYKDLCFQINGVLFNAQNALGTKFQEKHYVNTVCAFLDDLHITYKVEVPFKIILKGKLIGSFRADMVVDNKILIEFKVTDRLTADHKMQMLRYLQALDLRLGLLVNFRVRPLQIWRVPN